MTSNLSSLINYDYIVLDYSFVLANTDQNVINQLMTLANIKNEQMGQNFVIHSYNNYDLKINFHYYEYGSLSSKEVKDRAINNYAPLSKYLNLYDYTCLDEGNFEIRDTLSLADYLSQFGSTIVLLANDYLAFKMIRNECNFDFYDLKKDMIVTKSNFTSVYHAYTKTYRYSYSKLDLSNGTRVYSRKASYTLEGEFSTGEEISLYKVQGYPNLIAHIFLDKKRKNEPYHDFENTPSFLFTQNMNLLDEINQYRRFNTELFSHEILFADEAYNHPIGYIVQSMTYEFDDSDSGDKTELCLPEDDMRQQATFREDAKLAEIFQTVGSKKKNKSQGAGSNSKLAMILIPIIALLGLIVFSLDYFKIISLKGLFFEEDFKVRTSSENALRTSTADGHYYSENGKLDGFVEYYGNDGSSYKGDYKDGVPNGKAVVTLKDGHVYYGDIVDGKFSGQGEIHFKNGNIYKGDFADGLINGKGELVWNSDSFKGHKYIGDFLKGKREGKGEYTWPNGDVYVGVFKNDLKEGEGEFRFSNGNVYKGDFKEDAMTGQGEMKYKNGDRFIGEFSNGKPYNGNYIFKDGTTRLVKDGLTVGD